MSKVDGLMDKGVVTSIKEKKKRKIMTTEIMKLAVEADKENRDLQQESGQNSQEQIAKKRAADAQLLRQAKRLNKQEQIAKKGATDAQLMKTLQKCPNVSMLCHTMDIYMTLPLNRMYFIVLHYATAGIILGRGNATMPH